MHTRRRTWRAVAAVVALGLSLAAVPVAGAPNAVSSRAVSPAARSASTLVVRFTDGVSPSRRTDLLRTYGAVVVDDVPRTGFVVVDVGQRSVADVREALARSPQVRTVEVNSVVRSAVTPNDPYWDSGNQRLVRLPKAWDITKGSSKLTIAIVDTGVQLDHQDLEARLEPGWDFVNDDAVPDDDAGHGTGVAGVAAAITNNREGIAGTAWHARILPVKVLDDRGAGTMATVSQGITWAVDQGADVINLSLGSTEDSTLLRSAVAYAIERDVVVVAAAGNAGTTVRNYPAAIPEVVAVSAVGTNGHFAYFSSHGDWVDLAAPGMFVYSTSTEWGYQSYQGTSMAAPSVAGTALLVRSQHPGWTASEVALRLQDTAQDRGRRGFDRYYGHGLLDAYAAVGGPRRAPAPVPRDTHEPNGGPQRATHVGDHVVATIAPEADIDWYEFWAPRGRRVEWVVNPNGSTWREPRIFQPVVDVYDPEGTKIATVRPEPVATGSVVAPVAGTYRLRVRNSRPTMSHSNYVVTVGREGPETTLPAAEVVAASDQWLRGVATGDFTGDGLGDIAVGVGDGTPGLRVYEQRANGSFGQTFIADPTGDTSQIVAADMDRDGKTDAVVVADALKIYYQRKGRLQPPVTVGDHDDVRGVLVGQFTRDRRPDILVDVGYLPYLVLYRSTADGFVASNWYSKPTAGMAAGQLDGTGAHEIVTSEAGSFVTHTLGDDGRWSRARTPVAFGDVPTSGAAAVGDLTGDGRDDVVVSTAISSRSYMMAYVRTRAGGFRGPRVVSAQGSSSARLVDLAGDGRHDMIGPRSGHGVWRVHRQLGGGRFALAQDIPHGLGLYGIDGYSAADFDDDGIADFVMIGSDGANGSLVRLALSSRP